MKSCRIAVFGCKATTLFLLRNLRLPHPIAHLVTIDPEQGKRNAVADYIDLKTHAEAMGISVYQAKNYGLRNAEDLEHLRALSIDLAFVMGWQRLIPENVLATMRIGAFGMHGSSMDLPLGRGRSPMNWALLEGRKVFYTNLFRYDPGVDSGDVVDTQKFEIGPRDTAETMHFKNTMAMKFLVERNVDGLLQEKIKLVPQNKEVVPTYYPKRTPEDGLIDFALDVHALDRFIRAVARPFSGAFTFQNDERITIHDAQVFDLNEFGLDRSAPGTVAAVFNERKFLLKCIGGLLLVNEWEGSTAIQEGTILGSGNGTVKVFPRNRMGYHDLEGE